MNLSDFRKQRGMSQTELARVVGVTNKGWISQIETGAASAPLKMALRIELWSGGEVRALDLVSSGGAALLAEFLKSSASIPVDA